MQPVLLLYEGWLDQRGFIYEAQERGKNFALIIKSYHFEGIFIDEKGVNCASMDTVRAKKYFI